MKPPAFQFYADDFISGTADMTAEEVGVYVRLLCHAWAKGGLEDNDRLALMVGECQASSLAHAKTKFRLIDGRLKNDRQELEREKQAAFREKQAKNGSKRWPGNARPMPSLMPDGNQKDALLSPSPISNNNKKETPVATQSKWLIDYGIELPEPLRNDGCLEAVKTWLKYKKEKKSAYRPTGLNGFLNRMALEFTPATLPAAIENSIACNYQGVFAQKEATKAFSEAGGVPVWLQKKNLVARLQAHPGNDEKIGSNPTDEERKEFFALKANFAAMG